MSHKYCPICGRTQMPINNCYVRQCVGCGKTVMLQTALHEDRYYQDKSSEKFGDTTHWYEILVEEEVSKNPQFQKELLGTQITLEEYENIVNTIQQGRIERGMQSKPSQPKCPTCQSENVKKISVAKKATHGFIFGIFSKTAFSQFECCSCGYKW